MRFLKNKVLWLTIYTIIITGVFLYLLFPSSLVLQQMETAAVSVGRVLEAGSLNPSLPLGMKLKDVTVSSAQTPSAALFQGQLLDLQFNPVCIFQKRKTVYFKGMAYDGSFDGRASFVLSEQKYAPAEWKINFQNINLAQYNLTGFPLFKGITGPARGSAFYVKEDETSRSPVGKLSLYLGRGTYPLSEPFLGVSRIEFDRGEMQAQLKNGSVTLNKLDFYGARMNCLLNGEIQLANRMDESRLNLKGVLEIAGKSKIKINITVGGTLASPSFRYI